MCEQRYPFLIGDIVTIRSDLVRGQIYKNGCGKETTCTDYHMKCQGMNLEVFEIGNGDAFYYYKLQSPSGLDVDRGLENLSRLFFVDEMFEVYDDVDIDEEDGPEGHPIHVSANTVPPLLEGLEDMSLDEFLSL